MDWSQKSCVSRMLFESDVEEIENGIKTESIKIEPVVDDDDDSTLDLYTQDHHRRSDFRETIDISDDEGTETTDNQCARPSRRSSRPIVYRVRVMCQNIETQTEIHMKDAETTTDDFETYLSKIADNKQVIAKNTTKKEDVTKAINGESALGRNHETNNEEHAINKTRVGETPRERIANANLEEFGNGNVNPKKNKHDKTEPKKRKKSASAVGKNYYRCRICSCFYAYYSAFEKHVQIVHKMKKAPFDPLVPFEAGCKFCKFKGKDTCHYNYHIKIQHKKTFHKSRDVSKSADAVPNPSTFEIQDIMNLFTTKEKAEQHTMQLNKKKIQEKIIPKSTLFKCNKCSTHFLSCKTTMNHKAKCEKEEYKSKQLIVACRICQRNFCNQNIENHYIQHKHTNSFTTHELHEKTIDKYLYKCPSCQIYFNENKFKSHRNKKMCLKNKHYQNMNCNRCDLKIADECYLDHERLHQAWKYVKDFFILIDVLLINSK